MDGLYMLKREIEHLTRDDGSHYNFTGGIQPPIGVNGRNNRTQRRTPTSDNLVFDYNYRFWETFLIFLLLYTRTTEALAVIDNVVNGIFAIDIVLTFFVAYLDKSSFFSPSDSWLLRYAPSMASPASLLHVRQVK